MSRSVIPNETVLLPEGTLFTGSSRLIDTFALIAATTLSVGENIEEKKERETEV
jgi:hypothetical protein